MSDMQQLHITLPHDVAAQVRAKVDTGEYASESDVVRDGLEALLERDNRFESWLTDEVGPVYDRMKADPLRGETGTELRAHLAARNAVSAKA